MLKYILTALLAFTMLACGSDEDTTNQEANQNSSDQQTEQFQPNQQAAADVEVSEEELEKFAEVTMVAQQIQQESQQEMIALVEEEGLDVQTYNTIAEARFGEQDESELDVSEEDIQKFDAASSEIESMQAGVEQEMTEAIEAEGMDMDRFMQINRAMQQDQELQQRMQEMMMQNMQQGQQGQQGQQPQQQPGQDMN